MKGTCIKFHYILIGLLITLASASFSKEMDSKSLTLLEINKLVEDMPDMKARMYRESPYDVLKNIKIVFSQTNPNKKQLFESLIQYIYSMQSVLSFDKKTLELYKAVQIMVKSKEESYSKQDPAIKQLYILLGVYETYNPDYLVRIIEDDEYPYPAYKIFAKYLYTSFSKETNDPRFIRYSKELKDETFKGWLSRLPENIIGNEKALADLDNAIHSQEDIYFDFIHFISLLHKKNIKDTQSKIYISDNNAYDYIQKLAQKYPGKSYFLNNFRVWFLSVVEENFNNDKIISMYLDILDTSITQQKAIAFEYFAKYLSKTSTKAAAAIINKVDELIPELKKETDYFGLRGIAKGYILLGKLGFDTKTKGLDLLNYALTECENPVIKNILEQDLRLST